MTIKYSATLAQLFLHRGILQGNGLVFTNHAITIYSGSKPGKAAFVSGFNASYNNAAAAFLAHYVGANWSQTEYLATLTVPAAVNAAHSGTGAWAVLWFGANTAEGSMGTIPTTNFAIVDVSDETGEGIIRFDDLTFTSGVSKAILDGSIGAAMNN